jgi:hypothetical protein
VRQGRNRDKTSVGVAVAVVVVEDCERVNRSEGEVANGDGVRERGRAWWAD